VRAGEARGTGSGVEKERRGFRHEKEKRNDPTHDRGRGADANAGRSGRGGGAGLRLGTGRSGGGRNRRRWARRGEPEGAEQGWQRTVAILGSRHHALQTHLRKSESRVNIYRLAETAGTSVERLKRFYLKRMEPTGERVRNIQFFGAGERTPPRYRELCLGLSQRRATTSLDADRAQSISYVAHLEADGIVTDRGSKKMFKFKWPLPEKQRKR